MGKLALLSKKYISWLALGEKAQNLQNIALFKMQIFLGFFAFSY